MFKIYVNEEWFFIDFQGVMVYRDFVQKKWVRKFGFLGVIFVLIDQIYFFIEVMNNQWKN